MAISPCKKYIRRNLYSAINPYTFTEFSRADELPGDSGISRGLRTLDADWGQFLATEKLPVIVVGVKLY